MYPQPSLQSQIIGNLAQLLLGRQGKTSRPSGFYEGGIAAQGSQPLRRKSRFHQAAEGGGRLGVENQDAPLPVPGRNQFAHDSHVPARPAAEREMRHSLHELRRESIGRPRIQDDQIVARQIIGSDVDRAVEVKSQVIRRGHSRQGTHKIQEGRQGGDIGAIGQNQEHIGEVGVQAEGIEARPQQAQVRQLGLVIARPSDLGPHSVSLQNVMYVPVVTC